MEQLRPGPGCRPRSGILLSVLDLLFFIKPPMTTVWPSGVTTTVLADSMAMAGAEMGAVGWCADGLAERGDQPRKFDGATIISTMPSEVMTGVTLRMMPTGV